MIEKEIEHGSDIKKALRWTVKKYGKTNSTSPPKKIGLSKTISGLTQLHGNLKN